MGDVVNIPIEQNKACQQKLAGFFIVKDRHSVYNFIMDLAEIDKQIESAYAEYLSEIAEIRDEQKKFIKEYLKKEDEQKIEELRAELKKIADK